MQIKYLFITILFAFFLSSSSQAQEKSPKVVLIPDANLAAAVRDVIGNSITTQTLLNLTHLVVQEREIENLTGLEHARNLRALDLYGNAISDISPLSGLRFYPWQDCPNSQRCL